MQATTPLDLFRQRLPKIAYAMDQLGPMLLLPKAQAILHRYIQTQPKGVVGALPFDIDIEYAAWAWENANLPPPNLVVINPANSRAHYLYLIEEPIFLGEGKPATKAAEYMRTIHRAMIFQLKADPSFSGFTVKNPLNEHWPVWIPRSKPYDLDELFDHINDKALKFARRRTKPSEEIGLGRNVALFNSVRHWAYRWVLTYKETSDYQAWAAFVLAQTLERNAEFTYPLKQPEVKHTAKSIAAWTWEKFSQAGFSKVQTTRQKKQAETRRASTEARLRNIAKEIQKTGQKANTSQIASAANLSARQVRRYSSSVQTPTPAKTGQSHIYPDMANVRPMHNPTSKRVLAVLDLRSKGMTQQAIATELGIHQATVSRILRRAGV